MFPQSRKFVYQSGEGLSLIYAIWIQFLLHYVPVRTSPKARTGTEGAIALNRRPKDEITPNSIIMKRFEYFLRLAAIIPVKRKIKKKNQRQQWQDNAARPYIYIKLLLLDLLGFYLYLYTRKQQLAYGANKMGEMDSETFSIICIFYYT